MAFRYLDSRKLTGQLTGLVVVGGVAANMTLRRYCCPPSENDRPFGGSMAECAVLLIQAATAIAAEAEAPRSFAVDLPTDGVVYGQRGDGRLGRH